MITEYHGNGDPTSAVVQIEYEEVCQAIEIEKATKTLGFKSLLDSKPNRRRFHILVWIASKSSSRLSLVSQELIWLM